MVGNKAAKKFAGEKRKISYLKLLVWHQKSSTVFNGFSKHWLRSANAASAFRFSRLVICMASPGSFYFDTIA